MSSVRTDPEREDLVFGYRIDWEVAGPAVKFDGLSPATARELLDAGYMDPDARCGTSPTMAETGRSCSATAPRQSPRAVAR
jgi:hypothetical protein